MGYSREKWKGIHNLVHLSQYQSIRRHFMNSFSCQVLRRYCFWSWLIGEFVTWKLIHTSAHLCSPSIIIIIDSVHELFFLLSFFFSSKMDLANKVLASCHRPYWRCYFPNTQAIIYVVDSSDTDRLVVAREEFHAILEVKYGWYLPHSW